MKCVCGYEGEDFIRPETARKTMADIAQLFCLFIKNKAVCVYACPKCGTLKIEVSKREMT